MKILLVDDDRTLVKAIRRSFESLGYEVVVCYEGGPVLDVIEQEKPDIVILDIMLPGKDGLTVLKEIREKFPGLPVIMLTARSEDIDIVVGLEMGADDYVSKPFSMRELEARIKAVSRRVSVSLAPKNQLRHKDILVDLNQRRVWKNKMELDLTPKEFDLLVVFLKHPGMVFTRERLLQMVWGYDFLGSSRAVDIQVSRLREKIEDDPRYPKIILTKRGVGYYCE
ncbi:MAG: response regulator transcription factor [Bacillota bacterium]|jgi:two-component system response regulator VicR|nr:response regulator transcription factor [Candidatus Fermentithermobacillaceae bacterium]HAF67267.1 DNA-binding response regulator [Clostridiales bacterium UBA9857]HOA70533.1 response regulator transcription factor [Bacillota bacterium]HPZ85904.1 response regulator transcription factor [Bacillota bacterium]HQD85908.1 response regulator transcription factor [Bacillota bacterium]